MPDLSILIQIADYYDVDIREILNGERKSETMNHELKETLLKVADYSELEKEKALKAGNTAFMLMFGICTLSIVIQMVLMVDLKFVLGETIAVVFGTIVYLAIMVHNGIWEIGSKKKSTPLKDAVISVMCAGGFSVVLVLCILKKGAELSQAVHIGIAFFAGITIVAFLVLRLLAYMSKKNNNK